MKHVIAYVHSHWDREWYREFEDFRLRLIEVFDEVIEALKKNELPFFYFDAQTAALEDYLEIHPEKEIEIKKLIKEKKLRIGPFYCSADSFLVSGECLYKNFEMGIKKSKEFGETQFIGYLADTFGHSKAIPYILKSLNINKACMWRGLGNNNADINWDGIDVTYLIQGYFQDFLNLDLSIENKAELLKKYIDKISLKSGDNILLPIGADHLGIAKNLQYQIDELNKIYKDYNIKISTPFEYFDKIETRQYVSGEFLDNKLNFILPGVYSSRIKTKQANSESQWLLNKIAEPLQAITAFYFNAHNKQSEIDYAYKTLIKNHAHDSIYGCSLDKVNDEVMIRFEKVNSVSNGIVKRALRDISGANPAVINLSNNIYNGHVIIETEKKLPKWMNAIKISSKKGFTDKKLYNINEIPITEDITTINKYLIDVKNIKPFSLTHITKDNIYTEKHIVSTQTSIENENIKLSIKNNEITLLDKKNNEKYKDFISIIDRADIGDSYNFGALKNDRQIKAVLKNWKLKEDNNLRCIMSLNYELEIPLNSTEKGRTKQTNKCKINIDAILYNQSEYIEFNINWENKSKNHILQIGFNLKKKIYETISEDLYGTVKRSYNPDFDIYDKLPAPRGIEIKPNTSPMQRFVLADNIGLITKGNNEYEISKNYIYLTLLRATGVISNPKNPTRGTPAGPPLETLKLQCIGKNTANFAITFNTQEQELLRISDEFYYSNIALFTKEKDTTFFKINNRNVQVTSISMKENKLQLRLFNFSNKKQETEIIEMGGNAYKYSLSPYEIKNIYIY